MSLLNNLEQKGANNAPKEGTKLETIKRIYVLAGKGENSARIKFDGERALSKTCNIGKDSTILNIALLLEDTLEELLDFNFEEQNRVRIYMPSNTLNYITEKLYLDDIDYDRIDSDEQALYESIDTMLEQLGNNVVLRNISRCKRWSRNNTKSQLLLDKLMQIAWNLVPGVNNANVDVAVEE